MQDRATFVAMRDDLVVGTATMKDAEVRSVLVSPRHHRRGLGRILVTTVEALARKRGPEEVTVSSSLGALSFRSSLKSSKNRRRFFGDEETVSSRKSVSAICLVWWRDGQRDVGQGKGQG